MEVCGAVGGHGGGLSSRRGGRAGVPREHFLLDSMTCVPQCFCHPPYNMQRIPKILLITRSAHDCSLCDKEGYEGPKITSGILHLPEDLSKFEDLLEKEGHLALTIEESHYENYDLFAALYEDVEGIDTEGLYDLLSEEHLQE